MTDPRPPDGGPAPPIGGSIPGLPGGVKETGRRSGELVKQDPHVVERGAEMVVVWSVGGGDNGSRGKGGDGVGGNDQARC